MKHLFTKRYKNTETGLREVTEHEGTIQLFAAAKYHKGQGGQMAPHWYLTVTLANLNRFL